MKLENFIEIASNVKNALEQRKPVVALESTIISHGMPYPQNYQVANMLENISLQSEVTPATICLMDGKIKIGLTDKDLLKLSKEKGIRKVSRREIPEVLAKGETGATTVAATMICAHLAGIRVFATGGIGGVHRGAENTFDISTDLTEFSQTPVIVVTAGAKAILDLPKTLEYLETLGVPVFGFQTVEFPAFYSRRSNLKVRKIDSVEMIAKMFQISKKLDFSQGMIIANPIPENDEIPFEKMEEQIKKAISSAEKSNIYGQALTPYLLKKIVELTEGKSLKTNIKLVENNVKLACKIAKALRKED